MIHNIPPELRALNQWVCAGDDKKPLDPKTGYPASVSDHRTWGTFEDAVRVGKRIGFVLTTEDPYTIIDLDDKPTKPLTEDQEKLHARILNMFPSYTETSVSGKGKHIIVRGKIPTGVHSRDQVEIYSRDRYMICTGAVVRQAPIINAQNQLTILYQELKAPLHLVPLPLEPNPHDDDDGGNDADICERASNAANGEKYIALCNGEWAALGYPSQSEADFALLSMLAFYTPSDKAVRRLFRHSKLGKREKAENNSYLNRSLTKIRASAPPRVEINLVKAVVESVEDPFPQPPPGLVGELAEFFLSNAVRPVPEVAMAAAIGLMAGVCGRSYNVSGTGLNQYLILIAKTGAGKEAAHTGILKLLSAVRQWVPAVDNHMGPGGFASGQAILRTLDTKPCFLSIVGEFGLFLQQLSGNWLNATNFMLKRVLLDLYAKSGWDHFLLPTVYSDSLKNTKTVQAPAMTILGETTPDALFEGLNTSHIDEGLIPRFLMIEYTGDRPPVNETPQEPSTDLLRRFVDLVTITLTTSANRTAVNVAIGATAKKKLDSFNLEADAHINRPTNALEAPLWNRAHLKALKLAALIAVGIDPHNPVIEDPTWAINLVRRDIESVTRRFQSGDVGSGDSKQLFDLRKQIRNYVTGKFESVMNYGVSLAMHSAQAIPYRYLSRTCLNRAAFRTDRTGATNSLQRAIKALISCGELIEIPKMTLDARFSFEGAAYKSTQHSRKV